MRNDVEENRENKLVDAFRQELYADVKQGPARMELERRKLIARTSKEDIHTGDPLPIPVFKKAAAAMLAAAAVAAFLLLPTLFGQDGSSESIKVSGLWRVESGDAWTSGRLMKVDEEVGAKVLFEDKTTLWVGPSGSLAASGEDQRGVELKEGRILAKVTARKKKDERFFVRTPHCEVVVHGTVFSVAVQGGTTIVKLHEGEVKVFVNDESVTLSAGHQLEVARGRAISTRPLDLAGVMEDLLVTESTSELPGPPVPNIGIPMMAEHPDGHRKRLPVVKATHSPSEILPVDSEEKTGQLPEKGSHGRKIQQRPAKLDAGVEPVPKIKFQDPTLAHIEVIPLDTEEEKLFLKAYDELNSGHHASGRQLLEKYLAAFPEGRYWRRVHEILEN